MNRNNIHRAAAEIDGVATELELSLDAYAEPLSPDERRELVTMLRKAHTMLLDELDNAAV